MPVDVLRLKVCTSRLQISAITCFSQTTGHLLWVANPQLPSCIWPAEPLEVPPIWRPGLCLPRGCLLVPFFLPTTLLLLLYPSQVISCRGRLLLTFLRFLAPTPLVCLVPPYLSAAAALFAAVRSQSSHTQVPFDSGHRPLATWPPCTL
jgi:hypothetical protein